MLKTFVANRISKIQALTKRVTWHHVPSDDNPADMLSREIGIDRLIEDKVWWNGLQWITEENPWPKNMKAPETVLPELKTVAVTLTTITIGNSREILFLQQIKKNYCLLSSMKEQHAEEYENLLYNHGRIRENRENHR